MDLTGVFADLLMVDLGMVSLRVLPNRFLLNSVSIMGETWVLLVSVIGYYRVLSP